MLEVLSPAIREELLARAEHVRLPARATLSQPHEQFRAAYFPIDCVVSSMMVTQDGTQLEVFTIGREGCTGAPALVRGDRTGATLNVCQVEGEAYRLAFDDVASLYERHEELQRVVQRYLAARADVLAQQIVCNRLHSVAQRCARWLLLTLDRIGRSDFALTHEALATMLGVRRAGVSITAAAFQDAGFVSYSRGRFTIVDRRGLEAAACSCYEAIRDFYGMQPR